MKKVLLSTFTTLLMLSGAQAQTSFGLKAGLNRATYSNMNDFKSVIYLEGAAFLDIPVAKNFSIQPALSLQGKGFKDSNQPDGLLIHDKPTTNVSVTLQVVSLEIPVNIVYHIPVDAGDFFIGAGPYLGVHLTGKTIDRGLSADGPLEQRLSIKFSGKDKFLNRFDTGANFLAGYTFGNGLLLNAGYNLGFTNLISISDKTVSNRVLSFVVGYQF